MALSDCKACLVSGAGEEEKTYAHPLDEELAADGDSPEEIIIRAEEKMELFQKVHALKETEKEVVLLRITGAFAFQEIGELFGKSENWARVTFYRAKQKLVASGRGKEKKDEV